MNKILKRLKIKFIILDKQKLKIEFLQIKVINLVYIK